MDRVRDSSTGTQRIGQALHRREDDALLRGHGRFIDDLATGDCLHLRFLRSDRATGRIAVLDASEARAMPGVVLVITAQDLGTTGAPAVNALIPDLRMPPFRILADTEVGWVGEPIAAVVARTGFSASDAIENIRLDIQDAPAATPHEPVFEHSWGGEAGRAFADAAHTVSVTLDYARLAPAPMEPRLAMAECDADGKLTAWIATQTPHRARSDLSLVLGVPEERIRVVAPDVGGAFGGKASIYPEDLVVAAAAMRLRRRVKWVGTRSEEFLAATQGRGGKLRGELALSESGRFLALRARLDFPLGSRLPYSAVVPARNAARILPGPYRVPEVQVVATGRVQNTAAMGIFRGAGRPEAAMLMERLVEAAARQAGFDAIELRSRNLIEAGQLPWRTPAGETIDSGDFRMLLHEALQKFDYDVERRGAEARRRDGQICGIGMALYVEPCGQGWESADVRILADGSIVVSTGSSAQGQGRETAFAQIAADILARDIEDIRVEHGDTSKISRGIGALASRSTAIGGSAVVQAAEQFRETARAFAATLLQCHVEEVSFTGTGMRSARSGAAVSWKALGESSYGVTGLPPGLRTSAVFNSETEAWSSGCCIARVSIDPDTGALDVERLVLVDDAGTVVNPKLATGQLLGGIAQGVGEATSERMVYDSEGQLLTASFMDYAVPRAHSVPRIELGHIEAPSPCNLLGAKGVGEAGCVGTPAAILNAAIDALSPFGVATLDPPLTSEKLWRAISARRSD